MANRLANYFPAHALRMGSSAIRQRQFHFFGDMVMDKRARYDFEEIDGEAADSRIPRSPRSPPSTARLSLDV